MKHAFILRMKPSGNDRVQEALDTDHLIIGWACAKGLLDVELDQERFKQIIKYGCFPEDKNYRRAGRGAGNMLRFIRDMKQGDLVVVPHQNKGFYVGEIVEGAVTYCENNVDDDTAYRRPVNWLNNKRRIKYVSASQKLESSIKNLNGTSSEISDCVADIENCLKKARNVEPELIKMNNQIFYGPPGTGKTYKINELKKEYIEPSDTYSLPEVLPNEYFQDKTWRDCVFMALCDCGGEADVDTLEQNRIVKTKFELSDREF